MLSGPEATVQKQFFRYNFSIFQYFSNLKADLERAEETAPVVCNYFPKIVLFPPTKLRKAGNEKNAIKSAIFTEMIYKFLHMITIQL